MPRMSVPATLMTNARPWDLMSGPINSRIGSRGLASDRLWKGRTTEDTESTETTEEELHYCRFALSFSVSLCPLCLRCLRPFPPAAVIFRLTISDELS